MTAPSEEPTRLITVCERPGEPGITADYRGFLTIQLFGQRLTGPAFREWQNHPA
jgi:hypothetical protein